MKWHIFIAFLFIFSVSCSSQKNKKEKDRLYSRDSLFIAYTVNEWMKTDNVGWFERSRYYCTDSTTPGKKPVAIIDTILYSPDSLKLYSIVIIASDTCTIGEEDKKTFFYDLKKNKIYDARGVIGFREDSGQLWRLYHYSPLIQQGFYDSTELTRTTRGFFFSEFKNRGQYVKQVNKELVFEKFNYNINDPDFWTKSFVWQKGLALPGYYNFQLQGIVKDQTPEPLKDVPVIYPDSLRRLFK